MKKRIATLAVATFLLAGCGDDLQEDFNDAPRAENNDDPARTIAFPDGYGNVAAKCDGPNMVYSGRVSADGRTMAVVANDPRCKDVLG
jgi:hypothetical protein